ncbi:helix-turn-helix domain-containing protein [Ancylobacter sp. G4_0304]|uniref:helix-turn-helix domain-containing protein n=1 Tax=Ancylobacter sp. G4_0304 TaxID=3114289 RepID=UPI0039C724CE
MQLKLAGSSWTALAREIGVTRQAVQYAAGGQPSQFIERVLAAKIGVRPEDLFPEHWTSAGVRIPISQPLLQRAKHSDSASVRHVQSREVA